MIIFVIIEQVLTPVFIRTSLFFYFGVIELFFLSLFMCEKGLMRSDPSICQDSRARGVGEQTLITLVSKSAVAARA